jgi:PAS domain S-box-containing protein
MEGEILLKQALLESEARFSAFVDESPVVAWMKDRAGRYVYVNRTLCAVYGITSETILNRTDFELLPQTVAEDLRANDEKVFVAGAPLQTFEDIPVADGSVHHWLIWKFPFKGKGGEPYVGGLAFDLTEQERAKAALTASEEKFRTVFDQSPVPIAIAKADTLTYVNPAYCKLFHHDSPEQLYGTSMLRQVAPSARAMIEERIQRRLQGLPLPNAYETAGLKKDGTEFPMFVQVAKVFLDDGPATLAFITDLTERKRLETELRQAQKMECVGRLAGGVAHDFNNLLTVILGHAGILKSPKSSVERRNEAVEQIVSAADRAARLTRQLLAFSRRQVMQPRAVSINELVVGLAKMWERVLGEDIRVTVKPGNNLPALKADPGMLEQVLMNLVVNARDAMPEGGSLNLETRLVRVHPPGEENSSLQSCIEIRVSDTGSGIAPEHLPHIFDPFFTTKEIGKGTGLGLATVYGIVQQHSGWITVDTEIGKGTTFRVFMPTLEEEESASALPGSRNLLQSEGHETILLVEDEPAVRTLLEMGLEEKGYRVYSAEDAPSAMDIWRKHAKEIQVLVTDFLMPGGCNGAQLARQLATTDPLLKVIYISGYNGARSETENQQVQRNFLAKPFTIDTLASMIRNILTEARAKGSTG